MRVAETVISRTTTTTKVLIFCAVLALLIVSLALAERYGAKILAIAESARAGEIAAEDRLFCGKHARDAANCTKDLQTIRDNHARRVLADNTGLL
jgi:hypothetical protein